MNELGFAFRHNVSVMDCACPPEEKVCRAIPNVSEKILCILTIVQIVSTSHVHVRGVGKGCQELDRLARLLYKPSPPPPPILEEFHNSYCLDSYMDIYNNIIALTHKI